jgi:SAM-dependent methyltransferase
VDYHNGSRPSSDHLRAWDHDYIRRGRLWGGSARRLPSLPDGSLVLEIGCGDGKTLAAMSASWKVAALDISPAALRLARLVKRDACLILADGCRLPLASERFDAVFAIHVAGHLFEAGRRLLAQEAARVLVPGGRLFFWDFSGEDMRSGLGDEVERGTFRRKSGIITHYSDESEVEDLFSELKLDFIGTRRWEMRIRGERMVRAEVEAVMVKS